MIFYIEVPFKAGLTLVALSNYACTYIAVWRVTPVYKNYPNEYNLYIIIFEFVYQLVVLNTMYTYAVKPALVTTSIKQ